MCYWWSLSWEIACTDPLIPHKGIVISGMKARLWAVLTAIALVSVGLHINRALFTEALFTRPLLAEPLSSTEAAGQLINICYLSQGPFTDSSQILLFEDVLTFRLDVSGHVSIQQRS